MAEQSRKRTYRQRVTCSECGKEFDSDYADNHGKKHQGKKVKFIAVHDRSQKQLSFFMQPRQTAVIESDSDKPVSLAASALVKSEHDVASVVSNELSCENQLDHNSSSKDIEASVSANKPCSVCVIEPEVTSSSDEEDCDQFKSEYFYTPSTSNDELMNVGPNQPLLKEYHPKKFGRKAVQRDFNPEWFDSHPWLSYDIGDCCCSCFPCKVFMNNSRFKFDNWKKPERLMKHSRSNHHQLAMAKWLGYRVNKTRQTSVLKQLADEHERQVKQNRDYLRIIIECLMFTAQQNIAQRGHAETRGELDQVSDINRGNFLELLHMRSRDISGFSDKLQSQAKIHAQWTSPDIQNELIDIVAKQVQSLITSEARASGPISIIIDETSDISRLEQVSFCLRYVKEGATKESFIGFYSTNSTDGESLYTLVKTVFQETDLILKEIVGQCFDGAANMSGVHRGLATRMKETSPLAIYVHCYGHLLNLALQDTMTHVEVLRNALGTVQSLYNFIEASPKRHNMFANIDVGGDSVSMSTLKSQSKTRWSCRWEAVKAVEGQLPRIIFVLLLLQNERDAKTYSESSALLNAVCDFDFVFGISLLKVILSMTSSLSNYLQSKTMDVTTARRTGELTIQTLLDCRNEESFDELWERTQIISNEIRQAIVDSRFSFKEARLPRQKKPPKRIQALVGETGCGDQQSSHTEQDYYRVSAYFSSLDMVTTELKSRFDKNDQDVLCALGDVVLNRSPDKNSYKIVSAHYGIDVDLLESEKKIFLKFIEENETKSVMSDADEDFIKVGTAADLVQTMHHYDLDSVLPLFWKVSRILAVIPATSCSAERSFSALLRMKTYLRSTMGQDRLNNLAIINIERAASNRVLQLQMNEIIDTFGRRKNRDSLLF